MAVSWARLCEGAMEFVYLLTLACVGGIINHMRGEDGGMLQGVGFTGTCDNCFGYWVDHFYDRAVMGLPTGAILSVLTKKTKMASIAGAIMFASIFVGWGCYMGLGWEPNTQARSGVFDWFLGREMAGWDFGRRWARMCAGMSLRGMMWTLPAGYYLFECGYGWRFALSGHMMGLVYTLGFRTPAVPVAPDWDRQPGQDWAFDAGTPFSEFLWGSWLWLALLSVVLANPRPHPPRARVVWFEVIAAAECLVLVGSSIFYSTVVQHDQENFQQSLWGTVIPTAALLLLQIRAARACFGAPSSPSRPLISYNAINTIVVDHTASQDDAASDASDLEAAVPVQPRWWASLWDQGLPEPYGTTVNIVGLLSLLATLLTTCLSIITLFWNWGSPRYCTWEYAPDCMQRQ
eukprot:m.235105 g.235105  ORF g.235105 m.235105 type:complete len:404 (-) comp12765_c0_seq1:128-1339(-)